MISKNKYTNWKDIFWNKIQIKVYNLQYKTYCNTKKIQMGLVLYCQRRLVKLEENKLLVVRIISQDNREKTAAVVDQIARLGTAE